MKLYNLPLKTQYALLPDNALIERCLAQLAEGEIEAMKALYAETAGAVYGFALSILKNAHDAEDVLQDVYIRANAAAKGYKSHGKPMAWLLTITKNLALMRLREKSKTQELLPENEAAKETSLALGDSIVLKAALYDLGEPDCEIVVLHAVSGLKHREIAAMLNLPLPTVLSKYNRALKKLKQKLAEG